MHKHPSKEYIAMLEIKQVVRKWQDLTLSDQQALMEIDKISILRQKDVWAEGHK